MYTGGYRYAHWILAGIHVVSLMDPPSLVPMQANSQFSMSHADEREESVSFSMPGMGNGPGDKTGSIWYRN